MTSHPIVLPVIKQTILTFFWDSKSWRGSKSPVLVQKLRRFCWMVGFCLLVELHREGCALQPAQQACLYVWMITRHKLKYFKKPLSVCLFRNLRRKQLKSFKKKNLDIFILPWKNFLKNTNIFMITNFLFYIHWVKNISYKTPVLSSLSWKAWSTSLFLFWSILKSLLFLLSAEARNTPLSFSSLVIHWPPSGFQ